MYTHRELRTAIKALIESANDESAGIDVGSVYNGWLNVDEQDTMYRAFVYDNRKGLVRGWQFSIAGDQRGSGVVGSQEQPQDRSAVQQVIGWDVIALMSDTQQIPPESELEFWDMVQAVQERFRETPSYNPFASVGLDGVYTTFENRSGLNFPAVETETSTGRVHRAVGVLYTTYSCEVTSP